MRAGFITAVGAALLAAVVIWFVPLAAKHPVAVGGVAGSDKSQTIDTIDRMNAELRKAMESRDGQKVARLKSDIVMTYYKRRMMAEAKRAMDELLQNVGDGALTRPGAAMLYGVVLNALGENRGSADMVARGEELVQQARAQWLEQRLPGWFLNSESLKPYSLAMERIGAPPPDIVHDRAGHTAQGAVAANAAGYAGRDSAFDIEALACTIDRRDASDLTTAEFYDQYYDQGRPVVLFGENLIQTDGGNWTQDWSLQRLVARYGSKSVLISSDQRHAELYGQDAHTGRNGSLGEFMTSTLGERGAAAAIGAPTPEYVFTADTSIERELRVPRFFSDPEYFHEPVQALFSAGPTDAGSTFHSHGHAWFALMYGLKHFIMMPRGFDYGPRGTPPVEWMRSVRSTLPTTPAECTLRSGEIIYVPAGWHHAVLHLADSVGIAMQGPALE